MSDKPAGQDPTTLPGKTEAKPATTNKPGQKPEAKARHAQTPSSGGSATGFLALLIALGSAGGGYWLWQEMLRERDSLAGQNARLQSSLHELRSEQERNAGQLAAISRDITLLPRTDADLSLRLKNLETAVQALRSESREPERNDWQPAEIEYLLSIANQRLQLLHDVGGSILALEAADRRLAAIADPLYTPVRKAIASELQTLRALDSLDITGIALELGNLAQAVDTLPLQDAIYQASNSEPAQEPAPAREPLSIKDWRGLARALWADIKGLVTIRRGEQSAKPILPPHERYYLAQNLRLKLESARLALLSRNADVYQATLREAQQWVSDYFASNTEQTANYQQRLQQLAAVDITPAQADISGSLRALRNLPKPPRVEPLSPVPEPLAAPPAEKTGAGEHSLPAELEIRIPALPATPAPGDPPDAPAREQGVPAL